MLRARRARCILTKIREIKQGNPTISAKCVHSSGPCLSGLRHRKKKNQESHFYQNKFPWTSEQEFADHLIANIIHNDKHITAINKPHGIPVRADYQKLPDWVDPKDVVPFTMWDCNGILQERLQAYQFIPMLSLPRDYSGVIIYAKTEHAHEILKKYFRFARTQRLLNQKYWAVTVGVPVHEICKEPVNFAVKRIIVGDRRLSVKATDYTVGDRKRGNVITAIVKHRVLDDSNFGGDDKTKVALLEVEPSVVKWDLVQTYLTEEGLCSALGDHIYSPRLARVQGKTTRLDPEKCPPNAQSLPHLITKALGFSSESLIQHTPLHIHLTEVKIPQMKRTGGWIKGNKQQYDDFLHLTAPLPEFFSQTLNLLNLKVEHPAVMKPT